MRALRAILEDLLLDLLYELPSRRDSDLFTVDAGVVKGDTVLARGLTAADLDEEETEEETVVEVEVEVEEEREADERESA